MFEVYDLVIRTSNYVPKCNDHRTSSLYHSGTVGLTPKRLLTGTEFKMYSITNNWLNQPFRIDCVLMDLLSCVLNGYPR